MFILIVGLILFGSFSSSLSADRCRLDKIHKEVLRVCECSDYSGCTSELNKFNTFLKPFLKNAEYFCHKRKINKLCEACSINTSSLNDLISGLGNGTSPTGNGTLVQPEVKP